MTLSPRTRTLLSALSLLLALGLGGLLTLRAQAQAATVRRPVPLRPIAPGEILRAEDLGWAEFPAAAAAGTAADPGALAGRMARTLLRPGAPVAPEMVGEPDAGLPPGWGEVALKLPREAALGGGLREGDRVFVLDVPRQGEAHWHGPFAVRAVEGRDEPILRLIGPGEAVRDLAEAVARGRTGERILHLVRLPEGGAP